jgi:hypothetical protein
MSEASSGSQLPPEKVKEIFCLVQYEFDDPAIKPVLESNLTNSRTNNVFAGESLQLFWKDHSRGIISTIIVSAKGARPMIEGAGEGFFGYSTLFLLDWLDHNNLEDLEPRTAMLRVHAPDQNGKYAWGVPENMTFDGLAGALLLRHEMRRSS